MGDSCLTSPITGHRIMGSKMAMPSADIAMDSGKVSTSRVRRSGFRSQGL